MFVVEGRVYYNPMQCKKRGRIVPVVNRLVILIRQVAARRGKLM